MYLFNVRVYGILINDREEVLISDEKVDTVGFTKFPGGGLEYGEGLLDALKREFEEECGIAVEVVRHLYTTDFYEKSSFNESQIISIYYQVETADHIDLDEINKVATLDYLSNPSSNKTQKFRLVPVREMEEDMLTFKTDKKGWSEFISMLKS